MAEDADPQLTNMLMVEESAAGQRLDRFVTDQLGTSRTRVQRWIADAGVTVNGRIVVKASEPVTAGDQVAVLGSITQPKIPAVEPVAMTLDILLEDAHLIVLVKPAGLVVHPGAGTREPTLLAGLMHHLKRSGGLRFNSGFERPGIVHRLDKDTTGVMVCAKTEDAHVGLAQQFTTKTTIEREYLALLDGVMADEILVHESQLTRDPNNRLRFISVRQPGLTGRYRYAKSEFRRMNVYGHRLTEARIRLHTGRTHQIRVHAVDLKIPVVGDQLYHRPTDLPQSFPLPVRQKIKSLRRQMLHAARLAFDHPITGERMSFEAKLPADFHEARELLIAHERAKG